MRDELAVATDDPGIRRGAFGDATLRIDQPGLARLEQLAAKGIAVVTVPDIRWQRVDIKAVVLLPNVLAKQAARRRG